MINVDAKELLFAIGFIGTITPDDPHLAILSCVKFIPNKQKMTLAIQGKDTYKLGSISIPMIDCDEDREFVLPLAKISQTISLYSKHNSEIKLKLSKAGNKVYIYDMQDGRSIYNTANLDEFPIIKSSDNKDLKIIPDEFTKMLSLSEYTDSKSKIFTNIHLQAMSKELLVEAIDRFMGGRGEMELTHSVKFDIAVPSDIRRPLERMKRVALSDEVWYIDITSNLVYVIGEYWHIAYSTYNGSYPNLDKAYTNSNKNYLEIDKPKLDYIVSALLANTKNGRARLSIKDGILSLSNSRGAKHKLDGTFQNQIDNEIHINLYNISKIIRSIKEDIVYLQLGSNQEQMIFYDGDIIYFAVPYSK